jgi:hypothetical protein
MVGTPFATAVTSCDPRKIGVKKGKDMVAILRVSYLGGR